MANEQRITEIDKELFLLEMNDKFDDNDRAVRDRLTAERRALVKAGSKGVTENVKETKEEAKPMTESTTGVSIIENVEIEAFTQTMNKINRFQALVKSQLTENHDYGIIPGTKKPTLLKPGAEKILMLMGLTSEFDILDSTRDFETGFFQYQVKCRLYKNGVLITEGLAACNTKEKKYAYAEACNIDNTVLKMAKKRALVDATLLVASLSQIFTQDIEDMDLTRLNREAARPKQPEPIIQVITGSTDLISLKQAKRMFAISKGNTELCRKVCIKYGYIVSTEIKKADYDRICEEIAQAA
jgi:hypothetical protein